MNTYMLDCYGSEFCYINDVSEKALLLNFHTAVKDTGFYLVVAA